MKLKILESLIKRQNEQINKARESFESSRQYATTSELKSEGKYDTRSIEAGYLAGAQKRRVQELEHDLALLEEIVLDHSNSTVAVGSLVELVLNDGPSRLYFVSSTAGGTMVEVEGKTILVISAFSPLGSEVIGLAEGEVFELEVKGDLRSYKVLRIL